MKTYPKQGKWPTWYYVIVDEKGPILKDAQVPIYWLKKVAVEDAKNWHGSKVLQCRVNVNA